MEDAPLLRVMSPFPGSFITQSAANFFKMQSQKSLDVKEVDSSSPSTEMGLVETVENVPQNGMRRDLSRRHVNMIGLAGMVVSSRLPFQLCQCQCQWQTLMNNLCTGNGSISCVWKCTGSCRASWRSSWIHSNELFNRLCCSQHS